MVTRLEQIKGIEKNLNESGFGLGVAYEEKGFWIYKGDKVHAKTESPETRELGQDYPLIINLKLINRKYWDPKNLIYIQGSLDLKKILDKHNISYEIRNLSEAEKTISDHHENLNKTLSQLQNITS